MSLDFVSENTIGGSVSLLGGRGGLDIGGGVSISSGSSSSTDSGSVTMSSADADSGDNDGNAEDIADITDIDGGDDIGEDNAHNTHPSDNNTTITVHEGGPQMKNEKCVMPGKLFGDSADIVIFNIHIKLENDNYNNDDIDDTCSAWNFTIILHRFDYTFTTRLLVITLTLTLVIVCITDSISRFNTDSIRRSTQTLLITLSPLRISNLFCS